VKRNIYAAEKKNTHITVLCEQKELDEEMREEIQVALRRLTAKHHLKMSSDFINMGCRLRNQ